MDFTTVYTRKKIDIINVWIDKYHRNTKQITVKVGKLETLLMFFIEKLWLGANHNSNDEKVN